MFIIALTGSRLTWRRTSIHACGEGVSWLCYLMWEDPPQLWARPCPGQGTLDCIKWRVSWSCKCASLSISWSLFFSPPFVVLCALLCYETFPLWISNKIKFQNFRYRQKKKKKTNGAVAAVRVLISMLSWESCARLSVVGLSGEFIPFILLLERNYCKEAMIRIFPVLFQHTTVLPFILIEMRTSHHQYPSRSSGLAAICTFSVGYILW